VSFPVVGPEVQSISAPASPLLSLEPVPQRNMYLSASKFFSRCASLAAISIEYLEWDTPNLVLERESKYPHTKVWKMNPAHYGDIGRSGG
jgi:hypothetical protein